MKTRENLNALQQKTMAELDTDLKAKKSELFNLRFQLATGQLQNTAAIRECKKEIARVKTIIHEIQGPRREQRMRHRRYRARDGDSSPVQGQALAPCGNC